MNRILSAMVNGAVLSMALTAVVSLVLRLIPRPVLNAATRYVLWWITLAVALALPALYLPMPQFHSTAAAVEARPLPVLPAPVASPIVIPRPPAVAPPPRDPLFPVRIEAQRWPRWVLGAWMLASFGLLLRLMVSSILLQRIAGRASDAPARLLSLVGSRRRGVRLAGSPEIAIPAAVGPRHPAILIPSALLEELDERELEQIVLHEAAHLARRDDYALLLQRIVEAVLAFHPSVRWIARRIDLEREIACDDLVIAATGQARSYASCLTRIVELSGGVRPSLAAAGAAEDGSHLARRVDMLLDKTRHTGTRLLKARLTAMVAMVAALALLASRAPGFVAFASPIAHTFQRAPARILAAMPLFAHPEDQAPNQPEFEGRVIEDSSGNPLASAEVRFRKSNMRELAADLDTDRQGRVRAAGLPPGDYTVDVMKPNYVTASLQVRVPSAAMLVRLVRYGIIAGQVTDAQGHPTPGTIHAPYGQTIGGTRIAVLMKGEGGAPLSSVREQPVDQEGRYRIYDLPPGQYMVGVWYDGLKDGSGFQLYPDSTHPKIFTIAGGEDYSGTDFLITPRAAYQVSGRIENYPKGEPFALALGDPEQPAFPIAQTLSKDDGSFRFEKVPVGTYDLYAGGPQTGYGARASLLGPNPLYGRNRVSVTGQNVEGLSIATGAPRSFTVVVRGHGSDNRPDGCPESAAVGVMSLEPWGILFDRQIGQAVFGKEQTISGLAPGRFLVTAMNLPAGCYQVNQPVVDLSGEAPGPVAMELASAGSIRGVLRGVGKDASGYAVVLLEAGADAASQSRLAFPDAQARFAFESLRPGRYRIAAQPASEAARSRWVADVSRMVEIDVAGGAPTNVDLPAPSKGGAQ